MKKSLKKNAPWIPNPKPQNKHCTDKHLTDDSLNHELPDDDSDRWQPDDLFDYPK